MRIYGTLFFAVIAAGGLLTVGCGENSGSDDVTETSFVGNYDLSGKGYDAILNVKKAGDGYILRWTTDDGEVYYGHGIEENGVLAAVYKCKTQEGFVAFTKSDDQLTGLCSPVSGDVPCCHKTNRGRKIKPDALPFEGATVLFNLSGTRKDSVTYQGTLELVPKGDLFTAAYQTPEMKLTGSGFVINNTAVMGYSDKNGMGIAVYEINGNSLRGAWHYTTYEKLAVVGQYEKNVEIAAK